ncbi:RNA polymerase sigma factor [Paraburkholderia ferrariae]|uniref:RNA polymerase sigma factor n=1 Tax=Paraburkholderia ferrariae TaxID=386056 RepID=UPI0004889789|nr:hypothetical protein [Paraburkholderia ferrariae]
MTARDGAQDKGGNQSAAQAIECFALSSRFRPFVAALRRKFACRVRYRFPWIDDDDLDDAWQSGVLAVFEAKGRVTMSADDLADAGRFEFRLGAYLLGAAYKQALTRLRAAGKNSLRMTSLDVLREDEAMFDKLLFELGEVEPGPEAQMQLARRRRAVEQCIARLTELARTTFMMALGGMKDISIQQETNAGSAVAVRRRISEAKSRVIECVEKKTGDRS